MCTYVSGRLNAEPGAFCGLFPSKTASLRDGYKKGMLVVRADTSTDAEARKKR